VNVAIVGLGRVGSEFLDQISILKDKGVHILAAAELGDTPGKKEAADSGIEIKSAEDIAGMGESLDIIFDLTGNSEVRTSLRNTLKNSENKHTVIAPETFAYLVWSLINDKPLPDVHQHKGY